MVDLVVSECGYNWGVRGPAEPDPDRARAGAVQPLPVTAMVIGLRDCPTSTCSSSSGWCSRRSTSP
ncbi:hypothetical protein NKG94_06485 [Micromonospora sp. M12]